LLGLAGLAVDGAVDGAQAVELATRHRYDLVLMDLQMPRQDGLAATLQLRALPGYARTPVIALTANVFASDRTQCLAAGMNDFVAKPVDPEGLFATVARWLSSQPETRAGHPGMPPT
jgi:two-component system sensor histidine kinase/response regulator